MKETKWRVREYGRKLVNAGKKVLRALEGKAETTATKS